MSKNKEYWVNQSMSFDKSSDYYDNFRPSYPEKLINDIVNKTGVNSKSAILEIGAGSGKATELFVNKGFQITCIEPGENLAKKGELKFQQSNQVNYIVSRFEEWEGEKEHYDLILSAQAFHWVPKPIGYEKCYNALKESKYMCLFWNYYFASENNYDVELQELFKEYPIGYLDTKESLENKINYTVEEIHQTGLFKNIEVIQYPWSLEYDDNQYIGFLKTGNGYLTMDDRTREKVENKIRDIINRNGGKITREFKCTMFMAQKK